MTDPFEIYHYHRQNIHKLSSFTPSPTEIQKVTERYFWSEREHYLYVDYLRSHEELALNQARWKRQAIFLQISRVLGTRTPVQVKSHHQKMIKKWKSIKNIIDSLSKDTSLKHEQEIIVSTPAISCVKIEEPINQMEGYLERYQHIYYGEPNRVQQSYMECIPWWNYYAYQAMMSQELMRLDKQLYQRGGDMYEVKEEEVERD